jgi:hypothetical protein
MGVFNKKLRPKNSKFFPDDDKGSQKKGTLGSSYKGAKEVTFG